MINIITRDAKGERRHKKSGRGSMTMRMQVAAFEDGGTEARPKECGQCLDTDKPKQRLLPKSIQKT